MFSGALTRRALLRVLSFLRSNYSADSYGGSRSRQSMPLLFLVIALPSQILRQRKETSLLTNSLWSAQRATRAHFADTWQTGSVVAGCTTQNHLTLVTVDDPGWQTNYFNLRNDQAALGNRPFALTRNSVAVESDLNRRVRFNTSSEARPRPSCLETRAT